MYFVLLICVMLLLFISYKFFDHDIMHPAVFLNLFFAGAIVFGFYLYNYWHLYDYGGNTTTMLLVGISSFVIGSAAAKFNRLKVKFNIGKKSNDMRNTNRGRIDIQPAMILVAAIFSLLAFFAFIQYYRTKISAAGIWETILNYRINKAEEAMPGYLNIMIKIVCAFANCFVYVFVNNRICRQSMPKDALLMIPAAAYLAMNLFIGNRGNILILILSCFAAWYILYHRIQGWHIRLTKLFLNKGVKIALIVFILFWVFMVLMRNINVTDARNNFMTYICSYLSGPLSGLDMYLKQGGTTCEWWGQETFVALNNNLNSLLGIGHSSTRFLEFRSGFGYSVVNIYSSFRRFYHDFGYIGVILLSLIQGYITSRMYYIAKRKTPASSIDLSMVIYCFFFYTVPYTLTDELFYSSNISLSGLVKLMILIIVYKFSFHGATQTPGKKVISEQRRRSLQVSR